MKTPNKSILTSFFNKKLKLGTIDGTSLKSWDEQLFLKNYIKMTISSVCALEDKSLFLSSSAHASEICYFPLDFEKWFCVSTFVTKKDLWICQVLIFFGNFIVCFNGFFHYSIKKVASTKYFPDLVMPLFLGANFNWWFCSPADKPMFLWHFIGYSSWMSKWPVYLLL